MIRRACCVFAIGVAALTVYAAVASAEPVNILGGGIVYSRSNQAVFDLTLLNGWMRGEFGDDSSESWNPPHACFPCAAGSTIDPSLTETMPINQDISVGGVLHYLGASYWVSTLHFAIDSDSVKIPPSFNPDDLSHSSVAQFALHGLVEAWDDNHFSGQGLSLLGYGKARISFLPDGSWYATNFVFEDPAAVPEPGTLLLFAPFAAGAVARWRRR